MSLDILIIGGEVDPKMRAEYDGERVKFAAYRLVFATATSQLNWLLEQLSQPGNAPSV